MPPKREEREESPCGKCNKHVRDGIQCEICDNWWHPACAGMSSDLCECLGANHQLHWYCNGCNPGVGKMILEIRKIHERIDVLEDSLRKNIAVRNKEQSENTLKVANIEGELSHLRKDISHYYDDIESIKATLQEIQNRPTLEDLKLDEEWPLLSGKKFSEIAAKEVEKQLHTVSNDLHLVTKTLSETKKDVAEEKEKDDKKNNIIIYNIPEQVTGTVDDKLKQDKLFILELMNALQTGVDEEDIKKLIRLGKKPEDGKPRPLLLQFGSRLAKSLVMDSLFRLKNIAVKFNGITISHDMTKKEREACKALVDEAKEKERLDTSGEWMYRVRGPPGQMRIVSIKKKN